MQFFALFPTVHALVHVAHKGTEVQSCVVQLANLQESVGPLMASLEQQNIH